MDTTLDSFIRDLPKVELHLHLEGAVTAPLLATLARRRQSELAYCTPGEIAERLFRYEHFKGFLESYGVVCRHLVEPADYLDILESLTEYFRREKIRYAEVIYTPSIPWKYGRDGEAVLAALLDRSRQAELRGGPQVRWILDCVRQFGVEPARRTAELCVRYREQGVVAIGLGGDEGAIPMSEYGETFRWAKAQGLYVHVHAGEVGEPQQVWDALLVLGANRIGHGIQAARDPKLMEYLRQHAIGLDVCLTSNLQTRAWSLLSTHPFQLLLKRGVPVTLNTDDPGMFQTTLSAEYAKAARHLGLDRNDLARLALQSVRSAFLPHPDKVALMQELHAEIHRLSQPPRDEAL